MRIYIGIPAYGPIDPAFLSSVLNTVLLFTAAGFQVETDIVSNCSLIAKARNEIAARFMASGYDKLLFLDADLEWKADDAYRLVTAPVEVIGGAYRKKSDEVAYAANPIKQAGSLWLVSHIGTGFLCIARDALLRMTQQPVAEVTQYFQAGVRDGRYVGEDFAFCEDYRAAGGHIYLLPCQLTHWGRHGYTGDVTKWLQSQRSLTAPCA